MLNSIPYIPILFLCFILIGFLSIILIDKEIKSREFKKQQAEYKKHDVYIQNHILENPTQYYSLKISEGKESCMNENESRIFYYINCALDEFFPDKKSRDNYICFPQVSLHALFRINKGNKASSYNIARRNLIAKNIDFIICNKYYKDGYYYYKPIILIEIDGPSHYFPIYGEKALNEQRESDSFKNRLAQSFQIPMIRYSICRKRQDGKPIAKVTIEDRLGIKQMLAKYLAPEYL